MHSATRLGAASSSRCKPGPRSVGELAEGLPVSRPAVSQHLRVLKEAGLVSDRQGRHAARSTGSSRTGCCGLRDYFDGFWSEALERFREAARKETG